MSHGPAVLGDDGRPEPFRASCRAGTITPWHPMRNRTQGSWRHRRRSMPLEARRGQRWRARAVEQPGCGAAQGERCSQNPVGGPTLADTAGRASRCSPAPEIGVVLILGLATTPREEGCPPTCRLPSAATGGLALEGVSGRNGRAGTARTASAGRETFWSTRRPGAPGLFRFTGTEQAESVVRQQKHPPPSRSL
jgi:hypothetical protein